MNIKLALLSTFIGICIIVGVTGMVYSIGMLAHEYPVIAATTLVVLTLVIVIAYISSNIHTLLNEK